MENVRPGLDKPQVGSFAAGEPRGTIRGHDNAADPAWDGCQASCCCQTSRGGSEPFLASNRP